MTNITTPTGSKVHEVDYRFGRWHVMLLCGRQIVESRCTEVEGPVTCKGCIQAGERRTE